MNTTTKYFTWFTALLLATSCNLDPDLEECPYNVRLEYWYTAGGTSNTLPDYINHIDAFVFDSKGMLVAIERESGKSASTGELKLYPGKYTIIAWGNRDTTSLIYPDARIGASRLSEMQLYLDNPYSLPVTRSSDAYHHTSEKLYYNCTEVEVTNVGVFRSRAYMTHAHCLLRVTVVWKQFPPIDTGDFMLRLDAVPFRYTFSVAEYIREMTLTDPNGYILHPLPGIESVRSNVCTPAKMNIMRTLSGTLCSYRLTNADHPVLRIYAGEQQLVREIDLWEFFTTMHIDLDKNLKQEFNLKVEINEDKVYVSTLTVSDWENGGELNGLQ